MRRAGRLSRMRIKYIEHDIYCNRQEKYIWITSVWNFLFLSVQGTNFTQWTLQDRLSRIQAQTLIWINLRILDCIAFWSWIRTRCRYRSPLSPSIIICSLSWDNRCHRTLTASFDWLQLLPEPRGSPAVIISHRPFTTLDILTMAQCYLCVSVKWPSRHTIFVSLMSVS